LSLAGLAVRPKPDCPQTKALIRRLTDLEVGDAIIHRFPAWVFRDALAEIGGLMRFHVDDDTRVLTCTHKKR
jgi:hypothetical protein